MRGGKEGPIWKKKGVVSGGCLGAFNMNRIQLYEYSCGEWKQKAFITFGSFPMFPRYFKKACAALQLGLSKPLFISHQLCVQCQCCSNRHIPSVWKQRKCRFSTVWLASRFSRWRAEASDRVTCTQCPAL